MRLKVFCFLLVCVFFTQIQNLQSQKFSPEANFIESEEWCKTVTIPFFESGETDPYRAKYVDIDWNITIEQWENFLNTLNPTSINKTENEISGSYCTKWLDGSINTCSVNISIKFDSEKKAKNISFHFDIANNYSWSEARYMFFGDKLLKASKEKKSDVIPLKEHAMHFNSGQNAHTIITKNCENFTITSSVQIIGSASVWVDYKKEKVQISSKLVNKSLVKEKDQTSKVATVFDKFWKEFQNSVKNKDKDKIISNTNFPYFSWDIVQQNYELFSKEKFAPNDNNNYFVGVKNFLMNKKIKTCILKSYSIGSFNPDITFFTDFPNLKDKNLIEVGLKTKDYGLQSLIFMVDGDSCILIGETVLTNDN